MLRNIFKKSSGKKRQLVVNCEKLETRVALLNEGRLEEHLLERSDVGISAGSVYLGRIVNIETSLQAAFVDIGEEKNAFISFRDMLPATFDMFEHVQKNLSKPQPGMGDVKHSKASVLTKRLREIEGRIKKCNKKRITLADIPSIFPVNTEVLVQVVKSPIGNKGARVAMNLSIAGRYLVLLPFAETLGLSRKISDVKERNRLKGIMKELEIPEGFGCICRTNAEGRKKIFLQRDLDTLMELWKRVESGKVERGKPTLLYRQPNLLERTVRDSLTEEIDELIIDSKPQFDYVKSLMTEIAGKSTANKVTLYAKASPVFEALNIESQINSIFERVVDLEGGGCICIDETEAMIAIDVNSGVRKGKDLPETILATNLAACIEIARHLRLRDIGGLVVIDFIDMRSQKDRDTVLKQMRKLVKEDRARSMILPISKLGLMQMTRQRESESMLERVFDPCPYCEGKGRIKSAMSMSVLIQRRLKEILCRYRNDKNLSVRVIMHPAILARLKNEDSKLITELEQQFGQQQQMTFRADPSLHHQTFRIVDSETGAEL
ncbi:MAG: Rne/Rng family ribonuclease [Victivallales bacterium]|nr:Rne/Rng family ribonuclease [Victivallales bacterium]